MRGSEDRERGESEVNEGGREEREGEAGREMKKEGEGERGGKRDTQREREQLDLTSIYTFHIFTDTQTDNTQILGSKDKERYKRERKKKGKQQEKKGKC